MKQSGLAIDHSLVESNSNLEHVGEETDGSDSSSVADVGGVRSRSGPGGRAGAGGSGSSGGGTSSGDSAGSSGGGGGGDTRSLVSLGVDGTALGLDGVGAVGLAASVTNVGCDAVLEGLLADEGGQGLLVVLKAGGRAVGAEARVDKGGRIAVVGGGVRLAKDLASVALGDTPAGCGRKKESVNAQWL